MTNKTDSVAPAFDTDPEPIVPPGPTRFESEYQQLPPVVDLYWAVPTVARNGLLQNDAFEQALARVFLGKEELEKLARANSPPAPYDEGEATPAEEDEP